MLNMDRNGERVGDVACRVELANGKEKEEERVWRRGGGIGPKCGNVIYGQFDKTRETDQVK